MWHLNSEIIHYLPDWFRQILEYQEICKTEGEQFDALAEAIHQVADNFFFQTMDAGAVALWEQLFGIVPNPWTETLDFRRARLLNRVSLQPPFTLGFLYQKLDELIGQGKWQVWVDYPNYTLYIASSAVDQAYATEVSYTVGRIKPAHIVYINRPYLRQGLALDESVSLAELIWQYRLGAWGLGLQPFALTEEKGVVTVAAEYSIQQELLTKTAAAVMEMVAAARVNGSILISDLDKTVEGNTAVVAYTVTPEQAAIVTQLELLDGENQVLTTSPVYVPMSETAVFTHHIPVEEATV